MKVRNTLILATAAAVMTVSPIFAAEETLEDMLNGPAEAFFIEITTEPPVGKEVVAEVVEEQTEEVKKTVSNKYSEKDVNLLAQITMAEAESQTELGKRLVIDVILNRVDSPEFPNTVEGVIFQKGQFSPTADGRWEQCYVKEDIRQLVLQELENRTNREVMFFRTKKYSKYGTPLFREDDHYFSSN